MNKPFYPAVGNGKSLVHVAWPEMKAGPRLQFLEALINAGFRYVILDLRDRRGYVQDFRAEMAQAGMQRRAVYFIGDYELWDLAPVYLGRDLEGALDTRLHRKSRVLVFDDLSGGWLRWTLQDKGFIVAKLRNSHDSSAIELAIAKGKADAILFGTADGPRTRSVKMILGRNGYVPVTTGQPSSSLGGAIQLWMPSPK
jgi:hypothetical protein